MERRNVENQSFRKLSKISKNVGCSFAGVVSFVGMERPLRPRAPSARETAPTLGSGMRERMGRGEWGGDSGSAHLGVVGVKAVGAVLLVSALDPFHHDFAAVIADQLRGHETK